MRADRVILCRPDSTAARMLLKAMKVWLLLTEGLLSFYLRLTLHWWAPIFAAQCTIHEHTRGQLGMVSSWSRVDGCPAMQQTVQPGTHLATARRSVHVSI